MASNRDDQDLFSYEIMELMHNINNALLGSIVSLVGIFGNVINIAVFSKQGFSETVNVSLFALSLSDLGSLVFLQIGNLFRNSIFLKSVPAIQVESSYLISGWPHVTFTRLSGAFTAYITMERCLCVLIPLRFKNIITPRFSAMVLISIFVVMSLALIPDYLSCYMGWKFDPYYNQTALGLLYFENRESMSGISYMFAGVMQIVSFVAVILFTSILVIELNAKSKWRASTSSCGGDAGTNRQSRDNRTVLMIIMIAVTYCICFLPHLIFYTITALFPEFNVARKYNNAYCVFWSFAFLVDAVNSTMNTFVYYRMSTKYRNTFHSIVSCIGEKNKDNTSQSSGT